MEIFGYCLAGLFPALALFWAIGCIWYDSGLYDKWNNRKTKKKIVDKIIYGEWK
jgi:hypothetical protein